MARREKELRKVEKELEKIELELVERYPHHFSTRDVVNAFFGAFIMAITFIFKGNFFRLAFTLPWANVLMLIALTIIFLSLEIYFIAYKKVPDKTKRKPFQFFFKRLVTFYGMGIIVSAILIFLFDIKNLSASAAVLREVFGMQMQGVPFEGVDVVQKFLFMLSLPASLGAAISDLAKKYY